MKFESKSARKNGKFRSSSQGFVLMSFLVMTPLILALLFLFSSVTHWINSKNNLESFCLQKQNESFFQQRKKIISLLNLNPLARQLYLEKKLIETKIIAATASGQLELVPPLKVKLEKNRQRRLKLDQKQNQIISMANEEFLRRDLEIRNHLIREQKKIALLARPLWEIEYRLQSDRIVRLAVEPEFPDLAPTYRTEEHFEEDQTWPLHWKVKIRPGSVINRFLKFNLEVQQQCQMTLRKDHQEFSIIVPDKSSLR